MRLFAGTHSSQHREEQAPGRSGIVAPVAGVREVEPAVLFTFAGRPGGVAAAADGTVFVSDTDSATIWRVKPDGTGAPVAGTGPGAASSAGQTHLYEPAGLVVMGDGSLLVADPGHHWVCAVSPDGDIRVVAGGVSGYRDGPAEQAMFRFPADVAVGPDGTCYVADSGDDRIRAISPEGTVSTVAGSIFDFGDGRGPHGRFRRPSALDVDAGGHCYVADSGNNAIRRVSPDGRVTTVAGAPPGGDFDGVGPRVGLHGPSGIAVDNDGSIWVADRDNGCLRHLSSSGASDTALTLSGKRWPVAVAVADDARVVIAVETFDDPAAPETQVLAIESGR